jgi:hypothetical protein
LYNGRNSFCRKGYETSTIMNAYQIHLTVLAALRLASAIIRKIVKIKAFLKNFSHLGRLLILENLISCCDRTRQIRNCGIDADISFYSFSGFTPIQSFHNSNIHPVI